MLQDVIRITTAGSVDDGKSTLIARLLLDTDSIPHDHLPSSAGAAFDPTRIADLLDGLESEQEQGITIDVAHRFFSSQTRRYHLADSPGHEQYTRNMATAAAGADALVLVIDATAGVKPQTKRHLSIAYLLGIRDFVVVANKMDLVRYSARTFRSITGQVKDLFVSFSDARWTVIPASGTEGAGVVKRSSKMAWFEGPTLLESLDALMPLVAEGAEPTVSIQMVQRLGNRKRQYSGTVFNGSLSDGTTLTVLPGKVSASIRNLRSSGVPAALATSGSQVSFEIDEERDIQRGYVLTSDDRLSLSHSWDATLVWLSDQAGVKGRSYLAKLGYQAQRITITKVQKFAMSDESEGELRYLDANEIYRVAVSTQQDFVLAPFEEFPEFGRFVLIDPETGQTVAVGTINYSLRRSGNIYPHHYSLDLQKRENLAGGAGAVLWFTGLSGSGKSTIADSVSAELTDMNRIVAVLDGDNLRSGLNRDLGFTESDRIENIRRTAEVAKLMADTGIVVLVCLISPFRADREQAKKIIGEGRFSEIYVATSLEVCEKRDPKGLYKKARGGHIPNFTGVNAPYEEPLSPALVLDGGGKLKAAVEQALQLVRSGGQIE
jgi:bifunctional enzyme CysN/CysC